MNRPTIVYHDMLGYEIDTNMHPETLRDIWEHWKAMNATLSLFSGGVHATFVWNGEEQREMLYDAKRKAYSPKD